MREKCDNCGEIQETYFTFVKDGGNGYALNYCYECGEKIEKILKEGLK